MNEVNCSESDFKRLVMWCLMPVKILMFAIGLAMLPFYAAIDYGTSPSYEKRYTEFFIRNFKGLVRFLTT